MSTPSTTFKDHTNVNVVTTRSQKVSKDEEEKATNEDYFIEVDLEVRKIRKNHKRLCIP